MSSFSLTEYLLRPVVMPEGAIVAPPAASDPAQTPTAAASSLQTVMRSSRARAWIPPHLIASLDTGTHE